MTKWLKLTLVNLLLVCLLGVVLRYKIAFSLPWIDQKFLLHAHSHFAFTGWITQALMVLMVWMLQQTGLLNAFNKYKPILIGNVVCAYGMLLSFPFQGYGMISISFSTLSIVVFVLFAYKYISHLKSLPPQPYKKWLYASLFLNILSAAGTFYLAYLMISTSVDQKSYLASVYFFLHFQYNGWFFFASVGLLIPLLLKLNLSHRLLNRIFYVFFFTCFPGYLLSILWMPFGHFIYWMVVLSALLPIVAWIVLLWEIYQKKEILPHVFKENTRWIFLIVAIAVSIKLLLQGGSVIPELSKLSYTYRPIIIGYLHLVLLGIFTIFLVGYMIQNQLLHFSKIAFKGVFIFVTGIILNELTLMLQGGSQMNYISLPYMNEILFGIALWMLLGLIMLNYGSKKSQ